MAVLYLKWRLKGDRTAGANFVGSNCGLCRHAVAGAAEEPHALTSARTTVHTDADPRIPPCRRPLNGPAARRRHIGERRLTVIGTAVRLSGRHLVIESFRCWHPRSGQPVSIRQRHGQPARGCRSHGSHAGVNRAVVRETFESCRKYPQCTDRRPRVSTGGRHPHEEEATHERRPRPPRRRRGIQNAPRWRLRRRAGRHRHGHGHQRPRRHRPSPRTRPARTTATSSRTGRTAATSP